MMTLEFLSHISNLLFAIEVLEDLNEIFNENVTSFSREI